ncbi:hypothetical protein HanIR_Chr07g0300301 [Helianthus annuus]|nr:hypothetical protein HanIR_Chr07g0300301 [Helianthus annuus]
MRSCEKHMRVYWSDLNKNPKLHHHLLHLSITCTSTYPLLLSISLHTHFLPLIKPTQSRPPSSRSWFGTTCNIRRTDLKSSPNQETNGCKPWRSWF